MHYEINLSEANATEPRTNMTEFPGTLRPGGTDQARLAGIRPHGTVSVDVRQTRLATG